MKKLLQFIFILSTCFSVQASHIVGGDIYYDYLGNNQYRIHVSVFRDCLSAGADFDSPLPLGIFFNSNNNLYQSINIPYTGKTMVPVTFNNPCVIPPTNICTENAIYTTVVTLPPNSGGYRVAYVRCCRGPNINNINNPEDTGLTLTVNIPGSTNNHHINNSARFNNYPPQLLCNNDQLVFNHSATDADGDQLRYSLATPYQGGTTFNPMPMPTPAPPYTPVFWSNGNTQNQPLGPGSNITIDPNTGQIVATPNLTGRYVVGIKVEEIRDGVVISSMIRDFIFQVFNCNITMQAILPLQTQLPSFTGYCDGNLNVNFVNNSFGGTHYQWDFGDLTTTYDVSTLHTPSYNYPDTGKYMVRLVVNPGWPCTDTAFMEINLYNQLNSDITHTDSICLINNEFNFSAQTDGPLGTTFSWDFGPGSTPSTGTTQTMTTSFATAGVHQVILTSNFQVCQAKDTVQVFVIPQPIAEFEMPANYRCEGLDVTFINNTQNATNYFWDFGIPGATSTEQAPSFSFPAGGTYVVKYYASSNAECIDSMFTTIVVNERLEIDFTQSPDQCITGNSFDFVGTVSGPPHATYSYEFGPSANPPSFQGSTINGVVYSNPGIYNVTLTGQFDECVETMTTQVQVFSEPTIGFYLIDGLQCEPFLAKFVNTSTADTEMQFSWDFGDGGSSTETNPAYWYLNEGSYPVTLSVITTEGCINTLQLTQADIINIQPKPDAKFIVDREHADICHSVIQFTNQSEGADSYYYYFDDGAHFSHDVDPSHKYNTSGDHFVYMIASTSKGCTDTAYQKIYIEPFSVFIPNTFTPDGDEFNNLLTPKMWLEPFEWDFRIYNRWGEMVFQSLDYEIGWDGTYKGVMAQEGTYTYTVRYKPCTVEHHTETLKGFIHLLK